MTPPFTDSNYHEYLLYNVDDVELDILILPPITGVYVQGVSVLEESVEMWEDGIAALAPTWLRNGIKFNVYTAGFEHVPNEVLADPEIVIVSSELVPLAYAGIGLDPMNFFGLYACHGQAFPVNSQDELDRLDGYHQHENSMWGVRRVECKNGGSTCFVINASSLFGTSPNSRRTHFDLNSHEFGHCLGIGHVGDAGDFTARAYPRDDIMSYEQDGWDPGHVLCVSTLNIRALETTYGHLLGQSPPRNPSPGYVHMVPSDWRAGTCVEPAAYAPTDTGRIEDADPLGNNPPDEEEEPGAPLVRIAQPLDGAQVQAGPITVAGTVDRSAHQDAPLTADAGGPYSGYIDQPIGISGDASGGAGPASCAWTGDATFANSDACATTATLSSLGEHVLTLTVTDGSNTAQDTATVSVTEPPLPGGTLFFEADGMPHGHEPILDQSLRAPRAPLSPDGPGPADSVVAASAYPNSGVETAFAPRWVYPDAITLSGEPLVLTAYIARPEAFAAGCGIRAVLFNGAGAPISEPNGTEPVYPAITSVPVGPTPVRFTIQPKAGIHQGLQVQISQAFAFPCGSTATLVHYGPSYPSRIELAPADLLGAGLPLDASLAARHTWVLAPLAAPRAPDTTAPADAPIQDSPGDASVFGLVPLPLDTLDVRAAWFRQDAEYLYVGMKVGDIPADTATTAQQFYEVDFRPSYANTWPGVPAANPGVTTVAFRGLRVVASLAPVDGSGPLPPSADHRFWLDALYSTTTVATGSTANSYSTRAQLAGSISAASDIVWWAIPLIELSGGASGRPVDGDELVGLAATTGLVLGAGTLGGIDSATSTKTYTFSSADTEEPLGEHVEIHVDGALAARDLEVDTNTEETDGFAATITLAPGSHAIEARWIDADGAVLDAHSIVVQAIDPALNEIQITSHADGEETLTGETSINGTAARRAQTGTRPSVSITPSTGTGEAGSTLTFQAEVTGDPAPACAWSIDEPNAAATFTTSVESCEEVHVRSETAETVTVRLTATNAQGAASDTAEATWTEPGLPLTADAGGPYSGDAESAIAILGRATGGAAANGFSCAWSTGDDGAFENAASCETRVTFATPGQKTLTLTVNDGDSSDADQALADVQPTGTHQVHIETPANGATIATQPFTLSGSALGTGDGTWVPAAVAANAGLSTSLASVDQKVLAAAGLFWEPWLAPLEAHLARHEGFLGLVPSLDAGKRSVDAYYAGAVPAGLDGLRLPGGESLAVHGDLAMQPLRQQFPSGFDVKANRNLLNGHAPTSALSHYEPVLPSTGLWNDGIGPGAPTLQFMNADYDDDGFDDVYGCTANFLWKDQTGKIYLGLAGHCVLPFGVAADQNAVGPTGFDTSTVDIEVCLADCVTGGVSGGLENIFLGNYVAAGRVAYARQTGPGTTGLFGLGGGGPGNDFALIEIPPELYHHLTPAMPVWAGPVDLNPDPAAGLLTQIHGNSIVYGETFAGKSRLGVSMGRSGPGSQQLGNQVWGNSQGYWMALMPGESGDSGSAVHTLDAGSGQVPGQDAGRGAGILTHGIGPWNILTKASRAVEMAQEAGLCIAMIPGHADPTSFPAPEPQSDVCEDEDTGPQYDVQYSLDQGASWASVDSFEPGSGEWSASVDGLDNGPATIQVRLLLDGAVVATDSVDVTIAMSTGGRACIGDSDVDARIVVAPDVPGNYEIVNFCAEASSSGLTLELEVFDMILDVITAPDESVVSYAFFLDGSPLPIEVTHFGGAPFVWNWETDKQQSDAVVTYDLGNDRLVLRLPSYTGVTQVQAKTYVGEGFLGGWVFSFDNDDFTPVGGLVPPADAAPNNGPLSFAAVHTTRFVGPLHGPTSMDPAFTDQEHVALFVNGEHAGSQGIDTSEEPFEASWSIPATLVEGVNTIVAEWYGADGVLLDATSIEVQGFRPNEPPIAVAQGPAQASRQVEAAFSGAGSSDPDGTVAAYHWDFGDGATGSGIEVVHTYADLGTYVVTLTVTDDDGATAQASLSVEVVNALPSASIEGPESVRKNRDATFTAHASDPDGDTFSFTWDFGDGTEPAAGPTATHRFKKDGTYTVTLTAQDADGGVATATHTIQVAKT